MNRRMMWILAALAALTPMVALAQDRPPVETEIDPNTNVLMWGAIVGFLMPALIAAINRRMWSSAAKAVCAFVLCIVAAGVTAFLTGDFDDTDDLVTAALAVFGAAITTYHFWWKPSGIAPKIEAATG